MFNWNSGLSMPSLLRVEYGANYQKPGVLTGTEPVLLESFLSEDGYSFTIPGLSNLTIGVIQHNGRTFTLAKGSGFPQDGEFLVQGDTISLFSSTPLEASLPVQVLGQQFNEAIPTDRVDPFLFSVFDNLPVQATVDWDLELENHPSGSIKMQVDGLSVIQEVRSRFRDGSEITFAGLRFVVSGYSETILNTRENPGGAFDVQIGLTGVWDKRQYRDPSFYWPSASGEAPSTFQKDPDCAIQSTTGAAAGFAPGVRRYKVSVGELAGQVGVPFVGYNPPLVTETNQQIAMSLGLPLQTALFQQPKNRLKSDYQAWEVPIPQDASRTSTVSWQDTMGSLLRQNGCFVDYTNPSAVLARSIDDVRPWDYTILELQWSAKGDCRFVDGYFGLAVQYRAAKITGRFMTVPYPDQAEDLQAAKSPPQVRWKRKEQITRTLASGDINASQPPPDVQTIRNMSLNHDASGRTSEVVEVTLIDGFERRRQRRRYGFAYLSTEVKSPDPSGGDRIFAPASPFWKLIEEETTEAIVDDDTGYVLGSITIGQTLTRFKQESDNLEYQGLDGDENRLERSLYEYFWLPHIQIKGSLLVQYASYYLDAQKETPPYDVQKVCNPDGSSSLIAIVDPNYARPMFELMSRELRLSFASRPNPDNGTTITAGEVRLPDVTIGQEMNIVTAIEVIPSAARKWTYSASGLEIASTEDRDLYISRSYTHSAQGPGFGEVTEQRRFETFAGRPGPAPRVPNRYEKEEPVAANDVANGQANPNDPTKEWVVSTPGYSALNTSDQTLDFPLARYRTQALRGVETNYFLEDVKGSVEFNFEVPFNAAMRPLDLIRANVFNMLGETYLISVVRISQSVSLQGAVNGAPLVTCVEGTKISGGLSRRVPLAVEQRSLPQEPKVGTPGNSGIATLGILDEVERFAAKVSRRGSY